MKILGIVVLYHPANDVYSNILSYITFLDKLIVWDNTPQGSSVELPQNAKIENRSLNKNVGIGKALNEAVNYARANGYTHLLTMDQDSCFEKDDFESYITIIRSSDASAIFSPNYIINNNKLYSDKEVLTELEANMTSGSIYPISIFNDIGLFREDFFIDSIDTEFAIRAIRRGYKILLIYSIQLNHKLGDFIYYPFLWGKIGTLSHSAIRTYYIIRNLILLKKIYGKLPSNIDASLKYQFKNRFIRIILVEEDKANKIMGLIMGYIHGKLGKTGEQQLFKN